MFAALFCMSAQAQKKGDFAVGVRGSACFSKIEILDIDAIWCWCFCSIQLFR